jgi:GNAT superfamily N-acetyltransferase
MLKSAHLFPYSGWILDKEGRRYRCTVNSEESAMSWELHWRKRPVGRADAFVEYPVLNLGDLQIEDDDGTDSAPGGSFRGRGLGGALLETIIGWARHCEFQCIRGKIATEDLDAMPGLLAWYERRGFTFAPEQQDCFAGEIELRL